MITPQFWFFCRRLMWVALALVAAVLVRHANAQSPVVFMTADPAAGASRLYRFDSGVQTFAMPAPGNGAFLGETVLNGNILISDYTNETIQRYSPSGALLSPFASFTNPTFLESDNAGNVYTTHWTTELSAVATRFNSAGAITQTYTVPGSVELAGIDADADGNVYVIDRTNTALVKFAANGTLVNFLFVPNPSDDITIDEAGKRLYLATETNVINVYNIGPVLPVLIGTITAPVGAQIVGLGYSPISGNVLAADLGVTNAVPHGYEFSPGGGLLRTYLPANSAIAWDIAPFSVPEPASVALVAFGLLGFATRRRRAA